MFVAVPGVHKTIKTIDRISNLFLFVNIFIFATNFSQQIFSFRAVKSFL